MKKTKRGFRVYAEFKDSKANTIRVQESSAACVDAVWIFATDMDGKSAHTHLSEPLGVSPHLNRAQARRLITALTKFVEARP